MYSAGARSKYTFGIYNNFYLFSFQEKDPLSKNILNAYTTTQLGGYYMQKYDDGYKPEGLGFNCYIGFCMSYSFDRKVDVYGEIGYDYHPIVNNVSMSNITYRIGASITLWPNAKTRKKSLIRNSAPYYII